AARHPDAKERIGPQLREHLDAQGAEEGRVAEHLGHVDREVLQQPDEALLVVQDAVEQRGQRGEALQARALPQAALERRTRVPAEVVAEAAEDALEQQVELEGLRRVARRGRSRARYR